MARDDSQRSVGFLVWLLAGVVGLITLLWLVVVILPSFFAPDNAFSTRAAALSSQNDVRTTLLQGAGALLILVSAVAGAYFTWRQVRNSTQTLQYAHEQLELARAGQVTERFTRAVDQLGNEKPDVRLGGIYALERIARDSERDCSTIVTILTAYVRTHSPWPPKADGSAQEEPPALKKPLPDIQAVLTVLGRLSPPSGRSFDIDLNSTDLRFANLLHACLIKADLSRAHMVRADLGWADLSETNLMWADLGYANLGAAKLCGAKLNWTNLGAATLDATNLQKADLCEVDLGGAKLIGADLRGAVLRKAKLRHANLRKADLRGADLRDADLRGTDLRGTDLRDADLGDTVLTSATADDTTAWPEINWRALGINIAPTEPSALQLHPTTLS